MLCFLPHEMCVKLDEPMQLDEPQALLGAALKTSLRSSRASETVAAPDDHRDGHGEHGEQHHLTELQAETFPNLHV